MTNPFTGNGFDFASMTDAINKLPNLYNRTASIFTPEPITATVVLVEQKDGTLNIVRTRPRGAAADKVIADKRSMRSFMIPHMPVEDALLPEDYQNVRQFGSDSAEDTQANIMAAKLEKMKNILDQTREFLRIGALKGIILDADGSTLFNLYTEFGITQKTIDFALDVTTTDVRAKCLEAKRHIETNLKGETMSGLRGLCSPSFYDAFTGHANVQSAFNNYLVNGQNLAGDYRPGFRYADIVWEEYNASWTDKDGNVRAAIAANQAIVFPDGARSTFVEVIAPGNFVETANTRGMPYYAKQEPKRFGQGIDLWAESNVLPLCKRPEVLVTVTI